MERTFAFHSYKGGTGKTTIAINLAAIYAQRQKNVCVLDFDFRAPSLHFLCGTKPESGGWLNDFLNGKHHISNFLHEINVGSEGKLAVGFANPTSDAMWDITKKDRKWWGNVLRRLLEAKRTILKDLGFDYLIFDTSPGVHYSSMNALAVSDVVVLTLKQDELDVEGTKELVVGFHEKLGRQTAMILNRVLFQLYAQISNEDEENLSKRVQAKFGFPVLGVIPCFCDLSIGGSRLLYSVKKPDHPFVKRLSVIGDNLANL
ncbi:ParA family protein [Candidatus Bathyarchaeota archaeon]|nr:ParA family protein [Candidatus Bathyarchaeota archaeon]